MSLALPPITEGRHRSFGVDKLGVLIAMIAGVGLLLPFTQFRANRIVLGEGRPLFDALPSPWAWLLAIIIVLGMAGAVLRLAPALKLGCASAALLGLAGLLGVSAGHLMPAGNSFARVSPASGFWLLLFAFALLATDALARLKPGPWLRIAILAGLALALTMVLASGLWADLSVLKEYASRAAGFWRQARTHLALTFGSVTAATLAGIPLGILCYKVAGLRAALLNLLNIVQTIPSIALFGLLISPLAWIAANLPGASAIGITGIGAAPAFVALFAYSLLPIVSNTLVGLQAVSPKVVDAARGMGMTDRQRLLNVELPLAFPVILTGIRIVLVQTIGLATVAALIGGGGFGVFVFQGIGQTAMDLVLLGAVPTVVLAFAAAVVLDACVEVAGGKERRR